MTRTQLRRLTLPALIAYAIVTILTLLARLVVAVAALVAEIAQRLADAGDTACAAARGPVVVAPFGGGMSTTNGTVPPVLDNVPAVELDEIDGTNEVVETGDARDQARQVIRDRAAAGLDELSGKRLGMMFGYGERWGRDRIAEVRRSEPAASPVAVVAAPQEGAAQEAASPTVGQSPTVAAETATDDTAEPGGMPGTPAAPKVAGAAGMYVVALMATVISANTSYRFFGERLGITGMPFTVPAFGPLPGFTLDLERVALFGVMEVALVVLAYAMRANVVRIGRPGPAQWVAWGVCAFAAFAAWELSGPVAGTARVFLGPVFGLVMLHLALGIEVKVRRGQSTGVWSQAGREVRERVLSRLGLGNDERTHWPAPVTGLR